jgi:hypothetical protein
VVTTATAAPVLRRSSLLRETYRERKTGGGYHPNYDTSIGCRSVHPRSNRLENMALDRWRSIEPAKEEPADIDKPITARRYLI